MLFCSCLRPRFTHPKLKIAERDLQDPSQLSTRTQMQLEQMGHVMEAEAQFLHVFKGWGIHNPTSHARVIETPGASPVIVQRDYAMCNKCVAGTCAGPGDSPGPPTLTMVLLHVSGVHPKISVSRFLLLKVVEDSERRGTPITYHDLWAELFLSQAPPNNQAPGTDVPIPTQPEFLRLPGVYDDILTMLWRHLDQLKEDEYRRQYNGGAHPTVWLDDWRGGWLVRVLQTTMRLAAAGKHEQDARVAREDARIWKEHGLDSVEKAHQEAVKRLHLASMAQEQEESDSDDNKAKKKAKNKARKSKKKAKKQANREAKKRAWEAAAQAQGGGEPEGNPAQASRTS